MAAATERMKAMSSRRGARGLRQSRLVLPDPRSPAVRRRVADEVERLSPASDEDALDWIESLSEFDEPASS